MFLTFSLSLFCKEKEYEPVGMYSNCQANCPASTPSELCFPISDTIDFFDLSSFICAKGITC